ncbi:hypothetical protein [Sphingomonas sp. Ant H11]|uniref:hypothetical protein n=1 Tax=Sphingomonas sp. Ant H11 TaxID=1564113 RepID=UPI000690CD8C|nr:hypothetical protein [Sphingomonas sp. Ant H11]
MFYLLTIAIQVLCVIDVIRNGRNQLWIMALVFLPLASTIAYVVLEVYPRFQGNRHVRTARATVAAKLDPDKDVRARAGRWRWPIPSPTACGWRMRWRRRAIMPRLCRSIARRRSAGRSIRAVPRSAPAPSSRRTILPPRSPRSTPRRPPRHRATATGSACSARAFSMRWGRKDEALELYADLVTRLPGEEGRCRYAALLLEQGWDKKAREVLEEVEARMKLLDRQQRAAEAEMYRWAMARLGELRAVKA